MVELWPEARRAMAYTVELAFPNMFCKSELAGGLRMAATDEEERIISVYLQEEGGRVEGQVAALLRVRRREVLGGADRAGDGDDGDVDQQRHREGESALEEEEPASFLRHGDDDKCLQHFPSSFSFIFVFFELTSIPPLEGGTFLESTRAEWRKRLWLRKGRDSFSGRK